MSGLAGQGTLMAIGVEPARVRVCLLEPVQGRYRLVGWLGAPRRAGLSMAGEAATLCRELGQRLRRRLWHDRARTPFLASDQPLHYPPVEHLAVTLTPVPRLRVAVLGLTAGESLAHMTEAVSGGPAQVVCSHVYNPMLTPEMLAEAWRTGQVEVLVVAGGYDAGPAATVASLRATPLHALLGCAVNALGLLPQVSRPRLLFAGGQWAVAHLERICAAQELPAPMCLPNVLPSPVQVRQNTVAQALHTLYAGRSQQTPGYAELAAWSNSGQAPTTLESNFARLVRAWRDYHNLPQLHGLYCVGELRLHVWATAREEGVRLCYTGDVPEGDAAEEDVAEGDAPDFLAPGPDLGDWPRVQLLCGTLSPAGRRSLEGRLDVRWWDSSALAPLVGAIGPAAPLAVRQVLEAELLKPIVEPALPLTRKLIA